MHRCRRHGGLAILVSMVIGPSMAAADGDPAPGVLRIGVAQSLPAPLVIVQPGEPHPIGTERQRVDGIAVDMARRFGDALVQVMRTADPDATSTPAQPSPLVPEVVLMPRLRLEPSALQVHAGGVRVDLICHAAPEWMLQPEAFHWSEPLYQVSDVVIARREPKGQRPPLQGPGDVRGDVAVVLDYRYPALEPVFATGQANREDSRTEDSVVDLVARGRVVFGVINAFTYRYLSQHDRSIRRLSVALRLDTADIRCAAPKTGIVGPEALAQAASLLAAEGAVTEVLDRYGAGPEAL